MASAILGVAGRAFFATTAYLGKGALKTGLTFSPMLLGDYILNDSKVLKALTAKGIQGALHPIDTFNRVADVINDKKAQVEDLRHTYGTIKDAGRDALAVGKGIVSGDPEAMKRAATAASQAAGKAKDKFVEAVSGSGDEEGSSWSKKLGWLAAFGGSGWLAKTLFFGGKSKDKDNDSGFSFGTLVKSALVILAAVTAFNFFNLGQKWDQVKGKIFDKETPTLVQRLPSDPTGRTSGPNLSAPPTIQRSKTPLGSTFSENGHGTTETGTRTGAPEITPRHKTQVDPSTLDLDR